MYKTISGCTITVRPAKVTGLKASNVKKTTLKLSWKKQKDVTGYKIYRYVVVSYKKVGKTIYKSTVSAIKNVKTLSK